MTGSLLDNNKNNNVDKKKRKFDITMAKGRRQSRFDYSRQYKKHRIVNDYKQTNI
jgi:hypothetical protein